MAEKLELVVSPIQEMPKLVSNIDELRNMLEINLQKYQNLVVTEDGIKDAKEDRANLNKLKKSISEERISQKKLFLAPFEEFETKCKGVEKLIDDTAGSIDSQIKGFEEREKETKRLEIEALYERNIGEYKKLIPLEKIFDERWLNKTSKLKEIEDFIKTVKNNADEHLQRIEELQSEFKEQLKDKYFETLDITSVLAENTRLAQQKKLMDELKAKEKAKELVDDVPLTTEEQEKVNKAFEEAVVEEFTEQQRLITITFKVECTKEQLAALGEYMKTNGIKYGRA